MVSTKGPSDPAADSHSVHPAAVRTFASGGWNLYSPVFFFVMTIYMSGLRFYLQVAVSFPEIHT
jgi:hypothetical protein